MTHKLYINAYFIIFSRPSRSSNLAPCLHGGRCGCRYPRGPQQQLNKKYSDYDYAFPPKGSNLRKDHAGREMKWSTYTPQCTLSPRSRYSCCRLCLTPK